MQSHVKAAESAGHEGCRLKGTEKTQTPLQAHTIDKGINCRLNAEHFVFG